MKLNRDFSEFIAFCIEREVRFLVVGGYALAAHGHPRYTKDLDVWIWLDPDNAARMVEAVNDFGFGSCGITAQDLLDPTVIVMMGHPPKRIDVIATIDGVEFDDCWPNRLEVELGGLPVPFIGLADFIANKRASGRPQDLADIDAVMD
ncbi:MAG: DUF6036 family nucleotidyltransferase [Sporichthyaceae bacterium]